MFTTKNVEKLDKDNILKYVSEYDIFRYYYGKFETGVSYNSPLRKDKNPSFNIYYNNNGKLYYKDFGHSLGDCFKFVSLLYNLSFYETLILINKDFNLKLYDNVCINKPVRLFETEIQKEKTQVVIQPVFRPFNEFDKNYWSSYGITKNNLLQFNVKACNKVFKDGYLLIKHLDYNPIYSYVVNGQYKIYKPLEKNKKYKWMSNMKSDNLFGLEQIDETKQYPFIFITSSLKDIMVLNTVGITAVAPIAEGVYINDTLINRLKKLTNNIIVNFDSDIAGVNYSKTLTERINCSYWNIPKEYNAKDISDFRKIYGYDKTKELLNKFL